MPYDFFTPYSELSENLKTVLKADERLDRTAWDTADDKERRQMVEKYFGPTGLRGKLTEEEMDYLEDCNMHTIYHFFEGWTEDD